MAEGKHANAFPSFGMERRGAPVAAFVKVDDKPIREITQIYAPDCLVLTDPFFRGEKDVYRGLKPGGTLVVNTADTAADSSEDNVQKMGLIDATRIALEEIKRPATTHLFGGRVRRYHRLGIPGCGPGVVPGIVERQGAGGQHAMRPTGL